ncbi:MAG TPA: sigma factor-like helix-turn-helix DNA-binding protein, partial [Gemmataceae bacterium]|nr:sigma factor-like helix-turn-helix DNA-binding protein [Gemmataceae bacterium]
HDAEDAAQAAFLVFARRAGSIRAAGLASWLFGVAVNTAREARRRSARHATTPTVPEVGRCDPDPDFDTRAVIAEELARLPDRYRELVVRCDLEGEPQAAVARRVGLPVGTVYSRLSTARSILAGRLSRRGIAAGVGLLAVSRNAAFAVSDCPSSRVTELTEAVMRSGRIWKWAAVAVLLAGVTLSAAERPRPAEAPAPRSADESKLAVLCGSHIKYLSPGGTVLSRVTAWDVKKAGADVPSMRFSVGLSSNKGLTADFDEVFMPHGRPAPDGRIPFMTRKGFYLHTPGGTAEPVKNAAGRTMFADDEQTVMAWSPDGKKALVGTSWAGGYFDRPKSQHAVVDLAAGTVTPLALPPNHRALDWSPDGSWVLTIRETYKWTVADGWKTTAWVLCKVSADGRAVTEISNGKGLVYAAAISPDGKTVAYMDYVWANGEKADADGNAPGYAGLALIAHDLATGAQKPLAREPGGLRADGKNYHVTPSGVRWSPDGTRIAFAHDFSIVGGITEWQLKSIAADGTDVKTVFTIDRKTDGMPWKPYTLIDWR